MNKTTATNAKPIVCRINMPLPEDYASYHQRIATNHKDLKFEILNRLEVDESTLEEDILVSGSTHSREKLTEELARGKGVKSVQTIEDYGNVGVYRITLETAPLAKVLKEMRVMIHYPLPFTSAINQVLVVAPEAKIEGLMSRIKGLSPRATIEKVRTDSFEGPRSMLTPRQTQILKGAMASGYWGIPRNHSSVPAVAGKLGENTWTITEDLSSIEDKLLTEAPADDYATFGIGRHPHTGADGN